jgi:orotidine 5'-phosphate decarboxylase subfamily 2
LVAARETFATRLAAAIEASGSLLCLGLDPDGVDTAQLETHCLRLIEATADFVCAIKPNLAFFEQHGSRGYAVLERLRAEIPAGRLLVLDGKRGDVTNTAAAYARALFDVLGGDAATINPLQGRDAVTPFLERPGRGVLLLARTSNPGASDFLEQRLSGDGRLLYERIVDEGVTWAAPGAIGFVVGATAPQAVAAVRRRVPWAPLLLPGVGAQGADLEAAVSAGLDADGGGAMVSLSRAIAASPDGPAAAARVLRDRINTVRSSA